MRVRAIVCACALSLTLAACGGQGGSGSSGSAPASIAPARAGTTPTELATQAARAFLDAYMTGGGRIQRTDQGGDTVSEGQAYGMLAAAAIGDRSRFDEIWSWTQKNLMQGDGLLAFHWDAGHVVDAQPAADADLDAARALLVASCRFHAPSLETSALRIGRAVLAHESARAGSLEVLLAGPWAHRGGELVFNPSYVDPTTLSALARVSGDGQFTALAAGGRTLVDELTRPLPPDWALVNTSTSAVTPVSGPDATSGPGMFTYDAPRTLVRFAVDPDPAGRSAVARAWSVFSATQPQDIVTEHDLSGAAVGTVHSPVTFVAVAGAAKAAGDASAMTTLLDEAQRLNAQHPTYYGTAWVALGRLMLTTDLLDPCAG